MADFESVARFFDNAAACFRRVSPESTCTGFAREPANLEDEVRSLAAALKTPRIAILAAKVRLVQRTESNR
jgi:hypothetical protein